MTGAAQSVKSAARLQPRPGSDVEVFSPAAFAWFAITHLVTIAALLVFFSWKLYLLALVLHSIFGVSITLGAHRYFSHKTFKAPAWLEGALAIIYTLSMDRCGEGIISWAAGHRFHHAYPDQTLDPHSPNRGFWHAYAGHYIWRRQDLYDFAQYRHYRPDLAQRPLLVWLDRTRNIWLLQAVFALLLFTVGGLASSAHGFDWWQACGFMVWGICGRYVFTQCSHSLVDTLSHGIGPFRNLPDSRKTGTNAKNNLAYWFMTFGNETWHNNHHAYPRAADNGHRWYQWDLDSFLMKTMSRLGIVSGLSFVPEAASRRNPKKLPLGCSYYAHRTQMPQRTVEHIEALSFQWGDAYDSYLINEPNREYFLSSSGQGVVGFVTRGRYVNVASGLIAPPAEKRRLLAELCAFVKLNGLTLSVFNVGAAELALYRELGFQVTKFGEDFVISLAAASWKGSQYEWVRRQTSFVLRHNVIMREELRSAHTETSWKALIGRLEKLELELLETKAQARPTAVFQGQLDQGELGRRRLFVAYAEGGLGTELGFVVCNPYDNGRSWAAEIFRHRPDAVRGVAPFLIHQAAVVLQSEGVEKLSLCIIPGIGCEEALAGDSALCRRLMVFWNKHLNMVSDMRGVFHFKTRFRPEQVSRFVCVTPRVTPGSIWAFLNTWGILQVRYGKLIGIGWRMLRLRRARAGLAAPTTKHPVHAENISC